MQTRITLNTDTFYAVSELGANEFVQTMMFMLYSSGEAFLEFEVIS